MYESTAVATGTDKMPLWTKAVIMSWHITSGNAIANILVDLRLSHNIWIRSVYHLPTMHVTLHSAADLGL
jgi:hypothetical protein